MNIHELSAVQMAEQVAAGALSSVEIVKDFYARIDASEAAKNIFCHQFREQALDAAKRADEARASRERLGPLHGLPITVKESIDIEGVPSTLGVQKRLHQKAERDAVVVRVLKEAGAIILGKTNVPQTLLSPMETTNFIWGTTTNPYSDAHGPGGSSGGEAAAIARGLSLWGVGTDVGGSIRIPASYCGIYGLKPTHARWSNIGSCSLLPGQEVIRAQTGPMARTASDLSFLFRALDSPVHAPYDSNVPPLKTPEANKIDLSRMRVGFYESDGFFTPAASVRRAVQEAVRKLEQHGVQMIEYRPSNVADATYLYFAAMSADGGAMVLEALRDEPIIKPLQTLRRITTLPRAAREILSFMMEWKGEARVARLLSVLGRKNASDLWALAAQRNAYQRTELLSWGNHNIDALLCPVHVTPAAPHGMSHDFTIAFCYSARFNVLNFPAATVPITRVLPSETKRVELKDRLDRRAAQIELHSAGLPVGVQLIARPWREDIVLKLSEALG